MAGSTEERAELPRTLVLPVPETVDAVFVVAAPRRPAFDLDPVARLWSGRMSWPDMGPGEPDPGRLRIFELRPADLEPLLELDLFRRVNAPDLVDRVLTGRRHLAVGCSGWPGWPARPVTISGGLANALAHEADGLVLDPILGTVVLPHRQTRFDLTGPPILSTVPWTRPTRDVGGLVACTGLSRFGIPDLFTPAVPARASTDWMQVLGGVGTTILQHYWEAISEDPMRGFVEIPNPLPIPGPMVRMQRADDDSGDEPDLTAAAAAGAVPVSLLWELEPEAGPAATARLEVLPPADLAAEYDDAIIRANEILLSG